MKRYYVYMLRCFDGTFYVGVTNDIERRYGEHEYGIDPECYTFSRRPLRLEFVGEFQWIDEAIAFEKQLKRWSHKKKRAFAQGKWMDLSRYGRGVDLSARIKVGALLRTVDDAADQVAGEQSLGRRFALQRNE